MSLIEEIKQLAVNNSMAIGGYQGSYHIAGYVAERKIFIDKQKLEYHARFTIVESDKVVTFTETLQESTSGLNSGSSTSDFGTHARTYTLHKKTKPPTIEDQATLYEDKYRYINDFSGIRDQIESMAGKTGYQFRYHVQ